VTEAPGKLGKQPPKRDPRTLRLARYVDEATWGGLSIPTRVLETPAITTWPMLRNNELGCCVEAAMGHVAELLSKLGRGTEVSVTDDDVVKAYSDIAGYVPGDPSTDNGTVMLAALNYWRKTGIAGHKILGYAAFRPRNHTEWKAANALFGATVVGIALPRSAQQQSGPNDTWRVVSTSGDGEWGSWGGHCVPGFDFDYRKVDVITWAYVQRATWGFIGTYCDEAYVVFDENWVDAVTQKAPNGFNHDQLLQDLSQFS
jgi:hypothetical protein